MVRGFYIGRFQPYHNGHQMVLEQIAREVDEIVIGVGSAQLSHEVENPFTAGERVLMITRSLEGLSSPFYVIPIEDIQRNALWVAHVRSMAPPFEIIYSNNPLVVQLFGEAGCAVRSTEMYHRANYSGTAIRELILAHRPWEHLVPPAVVQVIRETGGEERLCRIAQDD